MRCRCCRRTRTAAGRGRVHWWRALAAAVGGAWTSELLTVAVADPDGVRSSCSRRRSSAGRGVRGHRVGPGQPDGRRAWSHWHPGRPRPGWHRAPRVSGSAGIRHAAGGTPAGGVPPIYIGPALPDPAPAVHPAAAGPAAAGPGRLGHPAATDPPIAPDDLAANETVARRLVDWLRPGCSAARAASPGSVAARGSACFVIARGAGKATPVQQRRRRGRRAAWSWRRRASPPWNPAAAERVRAAIADAAARRTTWPFLLVHDATPCCRRRTCPRWRPWCSTSCARRSCARRACARRSPAPSRRGSTWLRAPDLVDRELLVPPCRTRRLACAARTAAVRRPAGWRRRPHGDRGLTPGFVVADLAAVRREAAIAPRRGRSDPGSEELRQQDLLSDAGLRSADLAVRWRDAERGRLLTLTTSAT
ncbi:hypothetical protein HBB16_20960 [Pseudonocardia sp. MCCB 268]|nr:hypothetical protein [Pseudonocardia cytotoxica]